MITTDQLTQALERQLAGTPHFLVSAEVRPSGKVIVEVDNDRSITLNDLTAINHGLRDTFGDALDDMELEVSSPGMGRPFKVTRQYEKHIGRTVEVILKEGRTIKGRLTSFSADGLVLHLERPSKMKGRPVTFEDEPTTLALTDIKSTQASINFN